MSLLEHGLAANLAAIGLGYLIGGLDMAWLVATMHGVDIRRIGNGNMGASNVAMSLGVQWGVVTAAWDIAKPILAACAARGLIHAGSTGWLLAPAMAVAGHVFPAWAGFRGGKGFAPYIGLMAVLDWRLAVAALAIGAILAWASDRIVAMTFLCIAMAPVWLWFATGQIAASVAAAASLLLAWKHRENARRWMQGTEPSIRKALAGKYKI